MQISDVVRSSVFCTVETLLAEVFELMGKNNCKCIPVLESIEHKVPVGAITEFDICQQLISKGHDPRWMKAANVMNPNISTVKLSADAAACLDLMKQRNVEQLFVVENNGVFRGIVGQEDLEHSSTEQKIKNLSRRFPLVHPV